MGKVQRFGQIGQVGIVNAKLALEGTIGDPAMLVQHGHRLAEDLVERHGGFSACPVTPWGASAVVYPIRTPQGTPGMAGHAGMPRLHALGSLRCHTPPKVSRPHERASQRCARESALVLKLALHPYQSLWFLAMPWCRTTVSGCVQGSVKSSRV